MAAAAPVLVVGGGPSGLVAALVLVKNHVPVRIIDKESSFRTAQRAYGLWPRTFDVFHILRTHEILQRTLPVPPICEYKPGTVEPSKIFNTFTHNDPTPSIPYNNPEFIGQPMVESILRSHLERYGCSVELGTELQSFEDDGERVVARLVKKKDGEEITETFVASYLIGADGAKGVTRKQLGLPFIGETKGEFAAVVGDICIEVEGVDRKHWHFFGQRSSDFLMFRPTDEIAPDGVNFLLTMKDYEPNQLIADEKLMFECMSRVLGKDIHARKIVALSEFRVNIRMVDKFSVGRVFLVGDSAHVHSPTGGQGLNACVQDAFNLAWKLALVHKGRSPATLLDSYNLERLPIIAAMLDITTDTLNKMLNAPAIEDAMAREKQMDMLGVNCRQSPVVVDEFTQAEPVSAYAVLDESVLVAGDRAPDAPSLVVVGSNGATETETRLFDVFSPTYHTALVFAPDVASATDVLEVLKIHGDEIRPVIVLAQGSEPTARGHADVVVDRDGHAYRAYLAVEGKRKVVVVRPDGVVGAVVHGPEGLEKYFSKIFV